MPAKHVSMPRLMNKGVCYIGDPLLSASSLEAAELYRYLNFWSQQYQLFSYSQPCDTSYGCGDRNYPAEFYLVLPPGPKADTSNPTRQLMGCLLPWCCSSSSGEVSWNCEITWQQNGGSEYTLLDRYLDSGTDWLDVTQTPPEREYLRRKNIGNLITLTDDNFNYTPNGSGYLSWGLLTISSILPASLGVWICPDKTLTYDEAQIPYSQLAVGKAIRGYESGEDGSLGTIIHNIGDGDFDDDSTELQTRRCLFQWAHPQGIYVAYDGGSWQSVFGNSTHNGKIKIWQQDFIDQGSSGTRTVYPAIVASGTGLAAVGPGYFRMTSTGTSDTWGGTIESDSVAKYDYISFADTLTVDFPTDTILCEAYCSGTGDEMLIHNVSIFSGSGWNE